MKVSKYLRYLLFFIAFVILLIQINSIYSHAAGAKQSNSEQNISVKWEKVDDGLYRFSFTGNNTVSSEDEKSDAFLEGLTKFKDEHTNEKITGYQPLFRTNPPSVSGYLVSTEKKAINGTVLAAIITAAIGLFTLFYSIRNNRKTLFVNNITSERVKWMSHLKEYVAEFISLVSFYNEKPALEDAKEKGEYLDKVLHAKAKIQLHLNYQGNADQEIMQLVEKMTSNIMTTYDTFTFLKQSTEEKTAYVLEQHKEQLEKRIKNKIEKSVEEANHPELPKMEDVKKIVEQIIQESKREEIDVFNTNFKQEFRKLKDEWQHNGDLLLGLTQKYLKEEWNRVKLEAEKGNISKKRFFL